MARRGVNWMVMGVVGVGGVLFASSPASAHVGVDRDEIEAGARTSLVFSFSHGCGESPTNSLKFQIPEGVDNAVPQVHPGWDVEVDRADVADPIESDHGAPVVDRPAVITFTAQDGNEVANGLRDSVQINFTAPETEGPLAFPVIQGCVEGTSDWIEVWDGTGDEPASPAPFVNVVAGTGGGDDGHGHPGAESDDQTPTSTPSNGADGADGDDAMTGGDTNDSSGGDGAAKALGLAGIVVGAAGLGVGGVALSRSKRGQ